MNPREEAKQLFDSGMSLPDISEKLNLKYETVKCWKRRDAWSEGASATVRYNPARNRRGAKKGADKKPSEPFLPGNQCSVVTQEHTKILFDSFTAEEMELVSLMKLDKIAILEDELSLLTVRERRMLLRIAALSMPKKPDTETIQRIEEALTRVQTRKQTLADQLHKFDYDAERIANERQRLGFEGLRTQLGLAPEINQDDGVVIVNDL